ncbi:hypothetical protein JTB14_037586 [Gonioctena quinquepunctata]|nr:hypothetical protein JTB14_037586 [Gonioctena quinquepunctata]
MAGRAVLYCGYGKHNLTLRIIKVVKARTSLCEKYKKVDMEEANGPSKTNINNIKTIEQVVKARTSLCEKYKKVDRKEAKGPPMTDINNINTIEQISNIATYRATKESYDDKVIMHSKKCEVKAEVTPEHKVYGKGNRVVVEIDEEEEMVLQCQCLDCVASEEDYIAKGKRVANDSSEKGLKINTERWVFCI